MNEEPVQPDRHYPSHQRWISKNNQSVIVFLTVCSRNRESIFANEDVHELLIRIWQGADSWIVGKYVILPDHIHLFAAPGSVQAPDLRRWVQFWKSQVSKNWPTHRDGSVWQRDVWDRQLRSGDSYEQKWKYVRDNPVRHGLVQEADDWPFQGELNSLVWHER